MDTSTVISYTSKYGQKRSGARGQVPISAHPSNDTLTRLEVVWRIKYAWRAGTYLQYMWRISTGELET
jgi:hypothetical protein